MGKLLVKFGMWIQLMWCKLICAWNALLVRLTVDVQSCPYEFCKCKK